MYSVLNASGLLPELWVTGMQNPVAKHELRIIKNLCLLMWGHTNGVQGLFLLSVQGFQLAVLRELETVTNTELGSVACMQGKCPNT